MTERRAKSETYGTGRREVARFGRPLRRASVISWAVLAGVLLGAGLAGPAGAQDAGVPARPLAQVAATRGHDPFPLVVANSVGEIRLPLSEIAGGLARYFTLMSDGLPVEFFVIWTQDNVIRSAYNACDICYRARLGYSQDGTFMVCGNCGNRFPVEKIGIVTGGCNPAPLATRIEGDELVVDASLLAAGRSYFP